MKKILVVVDMQNDFTTGKLGTTEAQTIIPNVINKIKQYENDGYDIVFTQDTHFENYLKTQEGKNLPVEHCIKGTDGWNISIDITKEINISKYFLYEKNTFGCTRLGEDIAIKEYDEVEIIGVCTGICVISNAIIIKSFAPEIKITVDASCCACLSKSSHLSAINTMKICQINIVE